MLHLQHPNTQLPGWSQASLDSGLIFAVRPETRSTWSGREGSSSMGPMAQQRLFKMIACLWKRVTVWLGSGWDTAHSTWCKPQSARKATPVSGPLQFCPEISTTTSCPVAAGSPHLSCSWTHPQDAWPYRGLARSGTRGNGGCQSSHPCSRFHAVHTRALGCSSPPSQGLENNRGLPQFPATSAAVRQNTFI